MKARFSIILPLVAFAWVCAACGSLNSSGYAQSISPPASQSPAPAGVPDPRRNAWIAEAEKLTNADIIGEGMVSNAISKMGSDVVVKGNVAGPVSVIGGKFYLLGVVHGPVSVVGGNATIIGTVDGPVSVVGGSLRVAGTIRGNASAVGGKVERTPDAIINGNVNSQAGPGGFGHATEFWYSFKGLLSIVWIAASMLAALIMPKAIEAAALTLPGSALRAGAIGLVYFVVAICFLVISIVLCFFLIGIPLIGVLMLVALGLKWFGYTVIFLWIGRAICRQLDWSAANIFLPILVGGFALSLLRFIPVFGMVFWFVLGVLADGITIMTLMKLQQRRNQAALPPPAPAQTAA